MYRVVHASNVVQDICTIVCVAPRDSPANEMQSDDVMVFTLASTGRPGFTFSIFWSLFTLLIHVFCKDKENYIKQELKTFEMHYFKTP